MTDVPCHSWIMPTLLRRAGVEFLHLGCNAGSSSPEVPLLFWWEGPDGSRLLTMYIAEGYGTGLMPPADWPYKTWLALIHTGDNAGPPKPEQVETVAAGSRETTARRPGPHRTAVRFRGRDPGRARPICPSFAATCPTRGFTARCAIRPVRGSRGTSARPSRPASRWTRTCGPGAWTCPDPRPTIARPTRTACCTANTRGAARCTGSRRTPSSGTMRTATNGRRNAAEGKFARLDASWDEHTAYIKTAQSLIAPLQQSQLQALAARRRCHGSADRRLQSAAVAARRRGPRGRGQRGDRGPQTGRGRRDDRGREETGRIGPFRGSRRAGWRLSHVRARHEVAGCTAGAAAEPTNEREHRWNRPSIAP